MTLVILTRFLYIAGMRLINVETKSRSDAHRDRQAWRDAIVPVALLAVAEGSLIWLNPDRPTSIAGVAWALSPLVGLLWLAWALFRVVGRADELQRVAHLEAMSAGFATMVIGLVTLGLLHAADIGEPAQLAQVVFMVGIGSWVAVLWARTRQRR
jgi:hypothetical protein